MVSRTPSFTHLGIINLGRADGGRNRRYGERVRWEFSYSNRIRTHVVTQKGALCSITLRNDASTSGALSAANKAQIVFVDAKLPLVSGRLKPRSFPKMCTPRLSEGEMKGADTF